MAHDEGYYAQQARWILETGDWVTPQWWGKPVYDRPIGIQWLMAVCYALFGISEGSARFPSLIACLFSVFLTYNIGCKLLNQRIAWLGAAILSVTPLWVEYGRLATQDSMLVFLELLGIWALLQAELRRRSRLYWGILAGSTLGLGFLIKGFMILLPPVALLPYLISSHRRSQHLLNLGLYLGLFLGALPLIGWFAASWAKYGMQPFQQLVGKLFLLGSQGWYQAGPLYYLWNIPANAFPWPLFALIGMILILQNLSLKSLLGTASTQRLQRSFSPILGFRQVSSLPLLLGYPVVLFLELSLFKTRTPYYPLQLLPFMSLLAALALDWLVRIYSHRASASVGKLFLDRLPAIFSYTFGGLAGLLVVAAIALMLISQFSLNIDISGGLVIDQELRKYSIIALGLGLGWLSLPVLWLARYRWGDPGVTAGYWLAGWLLGPWLGLMVASLTGLYGDYSPDVKAFLRQPEVATVIQTHPIDFVVQNSLHGDEHKTWVLLSFYTPQLGEKLPQVSALPRAEYAWVSPQSVVVPSSGYQPIATLQGWQLIQVR